MEKPSIGHRLSFGTIGERPENTYFSLKRCLANSFLKPVFEGFEIPPPQSFRDFFRDLGEDSLAVMPHSFGELGRDVGDIPA